MDYVIKVNGKRAFDDTFTYEECVDAKRTLRKVEPESVVTIELAKIPSKYDFLDAT